MTCKRLTDEELLSFYAELVDCGDNSEAPDYALVKIYLEAKRARKAEKFLERGISALGKANEFLRTENADLRKQVEVR